MNNTDKTADQIRNEAACHWIDNCNDTEIKRMYGHHMRSFYGGWDAASLRSREQQDRIKELEKELERKKYWDGERSDQQEERIKELKDERDSLSQMVLEMVGESEEQMMKEFLEFKFNRKALNL